MTTSPATPITTAASTTPDTATRIRDPRLLTAARVGWLALTSISLLLYLIALPVRFNQLSQVCTAAPCAILQLSSPGAQALQQLGIAPNVYPNVINLLDVIFVLAFVPVGALIFSRRSDDWIAIFVSLTLVVFGLTAPSTLNALEVTGGIISLPATLLRALSQFAFIMLLYLFPNGHFVPRWTRWFAIPWCIFYLFSPVAYGSLIWSIVFGDYPLTTCTSLKVVPVYVQ